MKKPIIFLMSVLCTAIILTGCELGSLEVPQKVVVNTDAVYNFNIASLDSDKNSQLDISQYFDIQKMLTQDQGNGNSQEISFNVYKYNDGVSPYQQLLLHMPVKEIEFDFGDAFKDFDISTLAQSFELDKKFSIPDIGKLDKSQPLDLSTINTAINAGVTFLGVTSYTPSTPVFGGGTLFDTVTYSTGKLLVDAAELGFYPHGKMTLKDGDIVVATGSFEDGIASLDISGKTIKATGMTLEFTEALSVGDYGQGFRVRIDTNSKLKRAVGVTLPSNMYNIPPVNVTFPMSLSEDLGQVTINEGSLRVEIIEPDSWEGNVIRDYSIDVSGGIDCSVSKTSPEANLINCQISNQDIDASATVSIILNDATIDFDDVPMVNVKTDIKKISATVALPDDFETSIDVNDIEIPDELSDYVEKITWKKTGFKIKYTNTLPEDNDLKLNLTSDFLGIKDTEFKTLEAGGDNAVEKEISFMNAEDWNKETVFSGANAATHMDIHGEVQLPGTVPGKLSVTKVEPGKEYSIKIAIEPLFEWDAATVKIPDNMNYSDKMDTGINKKALFESLGSDIASKLDTIQIAELPLYIFANIPSVFDDKNADITGVIKAYYATKDTNNNNAPIPVTDADPITILDTSKNALEFVSMPVLTIDETTKEVTNKFTDYTSLDFSSIINTSTSNNDATLFIDYNIGLGGDSGTIEITADSINELKAAGKTAIKIDIALILNLNFTLDEGISINLMDMINSQGEDNSNTGSGTGTASNSSEPKDLLGRTEATDISAYEQYLDVLKDVRLSIADVKFPIAGSMKLKVDWGLNNNARPMEIAFGDGLTTNLVVEAPKDLLAQYPLEPTIELEISSGSFGLKRDVALGGNISVGFAARGPITAFDSSSNGGNE